MTLREYNLRIEAQGVKDAYTHQMIALQAWESQRVQATTGSGKSLRSKYSRFSDFFDIDEELAVVQPWRKAAHPTKQTVIQQRVARMKDFRRLKAEGKIIPWAQRRKEASDG